MMNPGQMLLAGFSGLFTKVEGELHVLYDYSRKLKNPDGLDHLDMQHDQKNLKVKNGKCWFHDDFLIRKKELKCGISMPQCSL